MSATRKLNKGYSNIFGGLSLFAISPYAITFHAASSGIDEKKYNPEFGIAACAFLTFAVPVLPTLTALTLSLGVMAAFLTAMSMFVTYPAACVVDILSEPSYSSGLRY